MPAARFLGDFFKAVSFDAAIYALSSAAQDARPSLFAVLDRERGGSDDLAVAAAAVAAAADAAAAVAAASGATAFAAAAIAAALAAAAVAATAAASVAVAATVSAHLRGFDRLAVR